MSFTKGKDLEKSQIKISTRTLKKTSHTTTYYLLYKL